MKDQQITQLSILGVVSIVGLIAAIGLLSTPSTNTAIPVGGGQQDTVVGQASFWNFGNTPSENINEVNQEETYSDQQNSLSDRAQIVKNLKETQRGGVTRLIEKSGTYYIQNTFASNYQRTTLNNAQSKIESVCNQYGTEIQTSINYEKPSEQVRNQYGAVQKVQNIDNQGLQGEYIARAECELDQKPIGVSVDEQIQQSTNRIGEDIIQLQQRSRYGSITVEQRGTTYYLTKTYTSNNKVPTLERAQTIQTICERHGNRMNTVFSSTVPSQTLNGMQMWEFTQPIEENVDIAGSTTDTYTAKAECELNQKPIGIETIQEETMFEGFSVGVGTEAFFQSQTEYLDCVGQSREENTIQRCYEEHVAPRGEEPSNVEEELESASEHRYVEYTESENEYIVTSVAESQDQPTAFDKAETRIRSLCRTGKELNDKTFDVTRSIDSGYTLRQVEEGYMIERVDSYTRPRNYVATVSCSIPIEDGKEELEPIDSNGEETDGFEGVSQGVQYDWEY